MKGCLFCRIVKGEEEAIIVYEDKATMAFMDKYPVNPGHTLVVPKKHYEVIMDMPPSEVGEVFVTVTKVVKAVEEAVKADGVNIIQTNREAAWQHIFHVHIHIVPRFLNDKIRIFWPAKEANVKELARISQEIKERIQP